MVLNTEWAQVEVIDLINDGSGLAFGIIGGRSTGVVVKTIVPGGVADRDGRLQSGDHILQIGEVNLRGLGSEQVASVLRQCGVHVRMIVARPIESTSLDIQNLVSHAPVVPTKILGDPVELDRHLIENGFGDIFSALPPSNNFTTPYIFTGQQTDIQLHSIPRLNDFRNSTNGSVLSVSANLPLNSSKTLSLDVDMQKQASPETEMYTVKLCKDDLGLGITVAGYVCEKEEISGIFVKSISQGSAADINGKIKVNDRIVEVDGLSVIGHTNHQAVEILRNTGPIVTITLERYLRGPKYEQLQQAIRANELRPPSPPSPSISSLPRIPLSLVNSSIEPDGESRTSFDFDPAILLELATPCNEQREIVIDGRKSVQFSICSRESIYEKWKEKLEEDAEIVIAEMTKDDNSGLGISLEGTVDVERGQEVRPHHYIRNILPNGPVGKHGVLQSGDELLEVNGIQLLGLNHVEVVSILKQLPNFVVIVCARRAVPTRIINTAQCRDAFQARNILAGSLQTLIPNFDKLVKAKSDTSIASSSASDTCCSDVGSRSRSLEAVTGLPLWSNEYTIVDLVKGDYGLGFSILDYQDPLDSEKTVIVIRSLVPGGVAQTDGRLIPGDRLIGVNDTTVDHSTLDKAVQVLKSAPKGIVKITVAKPLTADNVSYHSQDSDQEDQLYLDEFQECIDEYQECLEVVQICIDDDAGSFNHSNSTTQLEEMKIGQEDAANNWLNVSFDSDVCKLDDLKTMSESDVSFKSTCDRSDSGANRDESLKLNTVCEKGNEQTKVEEVSEKDGYETCMDESLSEESKMVKACSAVESSAGEETPTNSKLNLKLVKDVCVTNTPKTVSSVHPNSSSEPFLNKNDFVKTNRICLDSKLDDGIDFYNQQAEDSLCGDEFFLVQCYKDDLPNLRPEVIKCSSEPNVLDTYEVCVPTVRYRRSIKEYYNDYEECLESYRIYTQQNQGETKVDSCVVKEEMADDDIFNEILLPMRSKSAPNILDSLFVTMTYDPGPDVSSRRKSAFVAGYPEDLNTDSMTVSRALDSSIAGSKSSDYSTMLQKHWSSIRKIEISRQANASLGISIVGGKVDINAPKTSPETILGIFIKNVVPDSPAGRTGKLNTGDRILEVSGVDLREVSHEKAVEIIRNAPNPVVFLIQSLIPWNVEDNHQIIDNKTLSSLPSPEKIIPPEEFRCDPVPSQTSPPPPVIADVPETTPNQKAAEIVPASIIDNTEKTIESVLKSPTKEVIVKHVTIVEEVKVKDYPPSRAPQPETQQEKIDVPKVPIEFSSQVFGLAKEVKPASKVEKTSASVVRNEKIVSPESSEESDDDEEDVRQLEGRTVSAKGHEIDRASAANVRRTKEEIAADPDEEDDFGYTINKVKKKYANLGHSILMVQLERGGQGLGLSLAGHKDRNCMAVFVCGINPTGAAYRTGGIQVGDEILEVNGVVLHGRCHLNASAIIKSLSGPIFKVIILRRKTAIDDIAVRPITQFPVSLAEESSEESYNSYPNVRTITVRKGPQGLGIMIIEGKHADVGQGIFISDIQEGSVAEKAGLEIGEMILAVNKDPLLGSNYENAATLLKRTEGIVTLIVSNPTKKAASPSRTQGEHPVLANDIGPSAFAGNAVLNSLSTIPNNISAAGSSAKPTLKAAGPPSRPTTPIPEPPADPLTCPIIPGKDTPIEINTDNKILGLFFIGGKDTATTDGIVIIEVYGGGAADKDSRLQPGDQILEVNGTTLKDATYTTASQALRQTLPKMKLTVYRPEKIDLLPLETELVKKPGKGFGLSVIAKKDGKGVYVSEILNGGSADVDGKIMKGDLLISVNNQNVENASGEETGAVLKTAMGKVALKLNRYKAVAR